jgi:hypothetical protein
MRNCRKVARCRAREVECELGPCDVVAAVSRRRRQSLMVPAYFRPGLPLACNFPDGPAFAFPLSPMFSSNALISACDRNVEDKTVIPCMEVSANLEFRNLFERFELLLQKNQVRRSLVFTIRLYLLANPQAHEPSLQELFERRPSS